MSAFIFSVADGFPFHGTFLPVNNTDCTFSTAPLTSYTILTATKYKMSSLVKTTAHLLGKFQTLMSTANQKPNTESVSTVSFPLR